MIDLSSELSKAAGDAARAARAARHINDAAGSRREQIDGELAELSKRALTDPEAAEQYQALILERGRVDRVLAA